MSRSCLNFAVSANTGRTSYRDPNPQVSISLLDVTVHSRARTATKDQENETGSCRHEAPTIVTRCRTFLFNVQHSSFLPCHIQRFFGECWTPAWFWSWNATSGGVMGRTRNPWRWNSNAHVSSPSPWMAMPSWMHALRRENNLNWRISTVFPSTGSFHPPREWWWWSYEAFDLKGSEGLSRIYSSSLLPESRRFCDAEGATWNPEFLTATYSDTPYCYYTYPAQISTITVFQVSTISAWRMWTATTH